MAIYKHDHTHITTPKPEEVIEFYTKVMGANIINEMEAAGNRMVDVDLGGIAVRISKGTAADSNWKGLRHGLHHLGFTVDNLDEFIADMKAKDVEVVTEPFEVQALGLKVAFIKGPEGELFELIEKSEG